MSRSSFIPIAVFLVLLVVHNDNFVNCKKSTTTVTSTTTRSPEKVQVDPSVNHALVHFMDLKRDEFLAKLADVKDAVASALNDYCRENDCGLTSKSNFTSEHIGFYGASEKEKYIVDGRFVIGKIYAEVTDGISKRNADEEEQENEEDLKKVLSKEIMEDFFTNSRDEIVNESEVQIAYVNNKLVYPARNNLDNYLIVSISCGFCVALIIFNLICQRKLAKKAKEEMFSKKNSIYNPDAAERSTPSKSGSTSSLKNRNIIREADEKETELEPLNDRDEDNQRYIEPVQRFPMPNETPMLATNQRYMSNIRTNPNLRLTQV